MAPQLQEHEQGFAPLTLDVELYQSYIDDPSMSEADKRELIETLWSIMLSFVDLGFGIHPLQQALDRDGIAGDAGDEVREALASPAVAMLSSSHAKDANDTGKAEPCIQDEARHDGS